jgi:hypothetical protein
MTRTTAEVEALAGHLEIRACDQDNDRYTANLLREAAAALRELARERDDDRALYAQGIKIAARERDTAHERHKEAIAMVAQLQGELARLREAAIAFRNRVGVLEPHIIQDRLLAHVHGIEWPWGTWTDEIRALDSALAASPVVPTVEPSPAIAPGVVIALRVILDRLNPADAAVCVVRGWLKDTP